LAGSSPLRPQAEDPAQTIAIRQVNEYGARSFAESRVCWEAKEVGAMRNGSWVGQ
jgi:hypothetical protein